MRKLDTLALLTGPLALLLALAIMKGDMQREPVQIEGLNSAPTLGEPCNCILDEDD